MALVTFVDDSAPYLSANNLNNNFNYLDDKIDGIIDSGSNANGYYIKYSDGTMICYKTITVNTNITTSWGSLYESENAVSLGNWAASFINTPIINATKTSGFGCWIELIQNTSASSCGEIYLASARSSTATPELSIIGIGKWK